jgi:hypothetical protein
VKWSSNIKVRAGALQYTIFIAIVIALLVFAFIGLSHLQGKLRLKANVFQEVVHTSNLGIAYNIKHQIAYNEEVLLPFLTKNVATRVEKKHWGIFDVITATSSRNKELFTKIALLGGQQRQRPALYLQDVNQPLVVVGNTRIEGKVYLSKHGVKRGSISGHSYMGNQLIYGTTQRSRNKLPEIENKPFLIALSKGNASNENTVFIDLEEGLKLVNSFTEPTKVIRNGGVVNLQFIELTGNIIVQSSTKIRVYKSALLNDVILIAPQIEILDKTVGNFQAIASKKIRVGKKCNLSYPTALIVVEKKELSSVTTFKDKEINQIFIDKSSEIRGVVGFISENKKDNHKAQIVLEEQSVVIGEVYCNQNFELKGTVKGSVYNKQFIAKQFGSIYKNHIYNGKIISNDLPTQFCGFSLKDTKPNIVKWLYY